MRPLNWDCFQQPMNGAEACAAADRARNTGKETMHTPFARAKIGSLWQQSYAAQKRQPTNREESQSKPFSFIIAAAAASTNCLPPLV
jgi:hypothetical protein